MSADGASVLVRLVCRYDGVCVVMFAATTPPAMRALMVSGVWFAQVSLWAEAPKLSSTRRGLPVAVCKFA